jgi:hypothetical protein
MRPFKLIEAACLAASMCAACGGWAQNDTVEVRVYGGQRDDRGLRLVELANGDVLALSSSNSTTDEEPHAWMHRFDSLVNPVWNATVSDTPLLQPVDAVEHGAGFITVLGVRYANASAAYDWGWYTLDAAGNSISEMQWGSDAWDIPARLLQRNDSLWSVGTTYATGGGHVHVTLHTWNEDGWLFDNAWSWDSGEAEEVTDAAFIAGSIAVSTSAGDQAHCTVFDALDGNVQWSYATPFDSPTMAKAVDVQDSTVVMLFNADTPYGMRLGFSCFNLQGDTLLQTIPGSGVDVAGEDIAWYGPNNFATIAATSDLGLGEGEWLFSRWTDGGVWQGGPTFGTQWDEIPAAILHASDGRLWMLGSTDGYSNGRDDVYLVVAPSPQVGNIETVTNVQVDIGEDAVAVEEWGRVQPLAVYPHPVRSSFTVANAPAGSRWSLSDAAGRMVLDGHGETGDASGLRPGVYVLQVSGTHEAIPVWVMR